jgi:hypothetical protein
MKLLGVDLPVPGHTHLSRRAASLAVKTPRVPSKGPMHRVVNSAGPQGTPLVCVGSAKVKPFADLAADHTHDTRATAVVTEHRITHHPIRDIEVCNEMSPTIM